MPTSARMLRKRTNDKRKKEHPSGGITGPVFGLETETLVKLSESCLGSTPEPGADSSSLLQMQTGEAAVTAAGAGPS